MWGCMGWETVRGLGGMSLGVGAAAAFLALTFFMAFMAFGMVKRRGWQRCVQNV